MNIDKAFESKYLAAADIPDDGDLVLTIKEVGMELLGQGEKAENKPVIYFEEVKKGMACNKTNATTIRNLYGPDTDQWTGKRIGLFATEVDFQGKQTLALRVRINAPRVSSFLTLDEALAGLDKAGISRDDFKTALKEVNGTSSYKPERDTALVRKLVAQNTPPEEPEITEESIAF